MTKKDDLSHDTSLPASIDVSKRAKKFGAITVRRISGDQDRVSGIATVDDVVAKHLAAADIQDCGISGLEELGWKTLKELEQDGYKSKKKGELSTAVFEFLMDRRKAIEALVRPPGESRLPFKDEMRLHEAIGSVIHPYLCFAGFISPDAVAMMEQEGYIKNKNKDEQRTHAERHTPKRPPHEKGR
jgi:hypothetical protein